MQSVTIDGKDLYTEYGFITASVNIQQPTVQTKFVDIPMKDGSVDLTNSVSDTVRYNDRTIKINLFRMTADESKLSNMAAYLHGQKKQIIFGEDVGYYYLGRISITSVKRSKGTMTVTLTATCEPFKYDVTPSDVDWEWDTFDLENGIINEAGEMTITGDTTFTLICRRDREFPIFTASENAILIFKGKSYLIKKGTGKIYNLFFDKGENLLTITVNKSTVTSSVVSIKYIGGSL